jgi:hypothetical protein
MSDNKLIVLNVRHQVDVMLDYLKHAQNQHSLSGMVQPNKRIALQVVHCIVGELMDQRNKNMKAHVDWDVMRAAILFGTSVDTVLHRQVKLAEKLFEPKWLQALYDDLAIQVNTVANRVSWTQWKVMNTGTSIVLVEGDDHRVLEYDKMMGLDHEEFVRIDLSQMLEKLTDAFEQQFAVYPISQVIAILAETITDLHPQVKWSRRTVEDVNYDMAAALGIHDLAAFKKGYIREVLRAFGIEDFSNWIDPGVHYLGDISTSGVMEIREREDEDSRLDVEKDSDADLARSMLNGDYLPPKQRERAERYILDQDLVTSTTL